MSVALSSEPYCSTNATCADDEVGTAVGRESESPSTSLDEWLNGQWDFEDFPTYEDQCTERRCAEDALYSRWRALYFASMESNQYKVIITERHIINLGELVTIV